MLFDSGPRWPRPVSSEPPWVRPMAGASLPSSCRLAQLVEVFHADAAPLARVRPDLLDGDDMLMLVAPGVPDEDREGADQAEDREPPDVPDDGEAADRGEEGEITPVGVFSGISIGW